MKFWSKSLLEFEGLNPLEWFHTFENMFHQEIVHDNTSCGFEQP